jgi:hypothetical protein
MQAPAGISCKDLTDTTKEPGLPGAGRKFRAGVRDGGWSEAGARSRQLLETVGAVGILKPIAGNLCAARCRTMLRTLAWALVVWGVAVWATGAAYLFIGITSAQQTVGAVISGGILVALGYWLERRTRRRHRDGQRMEATTEDRVQRHA